MRNITQKTTLLELAIIVCKHLEKRGLHAVMVGGSVVSIYTENQYQSKDIDFISPDSHKDITRAMKEIGFEAKGKDFHHLNTNFTIEFPSGPIAIGDDIPVSPEGELDVDGFKLKLLSPTQSVMDRLAWFFHYNDRQCLDQAVMICKSQIVSMDKIKAWAKREKQLDKFEIFKNHLN